MQVQQREKRENLGRGTKAERLARAMVEQNETRLSFSLMRIAKSSATIGMRKLREGFSIPNIFLGED